MSVYAICSNCKGATRLTERLALDLARREGPPTSLCCNAGMTLEGSPPTDTTRPNLNGPTAPPSTSP